MPVDMRGVLLAGGLGTRLKPMTRIVNKHLLPVYDRPMVYYPLDSLRDAGVREVCVVLGGREPDEFRELLGDGKDWGFTRFEYALQKGEGGIADAFRCARDFVGGAPACVILGDNIIQDRLNGWARAFLASEHEAMVFLSPVNDPERFGVPEFGTDGRITRIDEKPAVPGSNFAVVGVYFYRPSVFSVIDTLRPSARGELEITDVNNYFARRGVLGHAELKGFWGDAGTIEGLFRASALVRQWRGQPLSQLAAVMEAS